jgi:hypothetical protein
MPAECPREVSNDLMMFLFYKNHPNCQENQPALNVLLRAGWLMPKDFIGHKQVTVTLDDFQLDYLQEK